MVRNRAGMRTSECFRDQPGRDAGLGAVYVAASTVTPLVLKTTPSDLDLYFWPSAETVVAGHPLLIYSTDPHAVFFNDNGPIGLIPLVPIAALANALGWAGSLTGRAALTGAVVSLFVLLLAYQAVRLHRRPHAVVCAGRSRSRARCCSRPRCGSPSSTTVMSSSPSSCA